MGAVFISYRRGDSSGAAGRLFDRLERALGRKCVFMDVDSIEPGLDFVEVLNRHLEQCEVMLAVMGPNWLTSTDGQGCRRIDDPDDFVRLELANALSRGIRVIPILVDGATAVAASDLPDDLKSLARRQATEIRHDRFASDADQLVDTLKKIVSHTPPVLPTHALSEGDVLGTWRGELHHTPVDIVSRTWVLKPDGQFLSPHSAFVEKGSWKLERDELIITFPWGTVFRGKIINQTYRGSSFFPGTGAKGSFEMRKITPAAD